jgi:hypothetical protein
MMNRTPIPWANARQWIPARPGHEVVVVDDEIIHTALNDLESHTHRFGTIEVLIETLRRFSGGESRTHPEATQTKKLYPYPLQALVSGPRVSVLKPAGLNVVNAGEPPHGHHDHRRRE